MEKEVCTICESEFNSLFSGESGVCDNCLDEIERNEEDVNIGSETFLFNFDEAEARQELHEIDTMIIELKKAGLYL